MAVSMVNWENMKDFLVLFILVKGYKLLLLAVLKSLRALSDFNAIP